MEYKLARVTGQTNYFERLSDVDRKWWLAEELYLRENYKMQTITDNTFEMLRKTKGRDFKLSNDPCNYEILRDELDAEKLRYVSPI